MIIVPITPEQDLENITKPNWEFSKFDLDLIGENLKPGWEHNKTPLQMSRLIAQIPGANFQDEVAQAVQGDADEILRITAELKEHFAPYAYDLFAWIAYNFGRGDPGCANFHNWAGLVISGNKEAFFAARDKLMPVLKEFHDKEKPIHPELISILNRPYQIHYTARRIPKVTYSNKDSCFDIEWPKKYLKKTAGKPPTKIKL